MTHHVLVTVYFQHSHYGCNSAQPLACPHTPTLIHLRGSKDIFGAHYPELPNILTDYPLVVMLPFIL